MQYSIAITGLAMMLLTISITMMPLKCDGRRLHKRFVIHVPLRIRTHHHTHTVYKHIQTGAVKQTVYKILGYAAHGSSGGGSGGAGSQHYSSSYEHDQGQGAGEISYHDVEDCSQNHKHGDMIFNHFARHSNDYPEEEDDFLDVEQRDDWD